MSVRWSLGILVWSFSGALSLELATSAFAADLDDPASELASFKLAPGFEANLFASESDGIVKPIQSRFDARGRLWVVGSTVYPQLEPGQVPNDKVIILEDTDGDGRADKSTVFADGLFIPTGIEIGDGGCYVGNSTELLHLRDNDGDGKADERRVVLRGFGTGDNHQNINSFQWSPGGELWFSQGLHAHSRVETPWGVEKLDQAGIWRLRPRLLRLDPFFGSEMAPHNPWGFVFDDWNQMLVLAGNGHGIFDPLPVLIRGHRITPLDQIWKDYRGRKLCGGDIVGNAHFPDDWQGVMLAGGFMNNAIYALRIAQDGASFSVADREPLLTSIHGSFRPVDVKIGPDGAVYVTDWYNPIIGHYQASFRHPDRDKKHGRIWRITAKGRPLVKQPKSDGASAMQLLDHLKSTDRFTRLQAKRLLFGTETAVVTNALAQWLVKLDPSDPRLEHHRMEALGIYEAQEVVEPALLTKLLKAKDARVRAYAASVVGRWQDRLADPLALLRPLAADESSRVRLAAVVSTAAVPHADSMSVALAAVDKPVDKWLDYALRQSVFVLKPHWLPVFRQGHLSTDFAQHPARLEFLVKADGSADTLRVLRELLTSKEVEPKTRESFLNILAETGDANDLATLLNEATFTRDGAHDAATHARVLGVLEKASRVRNLRPAGDIGAALLKLWQASHDSSSRIGVLRLATLWRVKQMEEGALDAAFRTPADDELRLAGATGLAAIGGTNAMKYLDELAGPTRTAGEHVAAAVGFSSLDLKRAAEIAADVLSKDAQGVSVPQLLPAVLHRKRGASLLGEAMRNQPPSRDAARAALRFMSSTGREDKDLLAVFNAAAGVSSEPLKATPEWVGQLVAEVRERGDAARGREVFRRTDLNCLACHTVGAEGGTTGPDLNAIGSGQPLEFIIGAVLEPNREVKENYESIEVTMKDGESYTGYRVRSDDTELAMRDVARNQIVRLRRDQIASQAERGSLMPSGLVDHLTRVELRDLFRYLSELGKAK
jgi:putative heme-binding domain-containing protein